MVNRPFQLVSFFAVNEINEKNNDGDHNNNPDTVTGAGTLYEDARSPDRCTLVQKQGPGPQHATARTKWSKEVNIVVRNGIIDSNLLMRMVILLKGIGKGCAGNG